MSDDATTHKSGALPFDADSDEHMTAYTRARTEDPVTSHEAADAVSSKMRELQRRVLDLLQQYGPMTQHAMIAGYRAAHGPAAESTIRTRCAELVDKGLVVDTGITQSVGKRRAIVWDVKR